MEVVHSVQNSKESSMTESFRSWKQKVDSVLDKHYGMGIMDVDLPFRVWFEDNIPPEDVIELADEELIEGGWLSKTDVRILSE